MFAAVASPAQLEDLDEDSPAEGNTYFRVAKIQIIGTDPDYLQDVFTQIVADSELLIDNYDALSALQVQATYTVTKDSATIVS